MDGKNGKNERHGKGIWERRSRWRDERGLEEGRKEEREDRKSMDRDNGKGLSQILEQVFAFCPFICRLRVSLYAYGKQQFGHCASNSGVV